MKQLTFEVTLSFSNKITNDLEIREVQQNVLDAIVSQADTAGLAPEDSDAYTTNISVFEPLNHVKIAHKI